MIIASARFSSHRRSATRVYLFAKVCRAAPTICPPSELCAPRPAKPRRAPTRAPRIWMCGGRALKSYLAPSLRCASPGWPNHGERPRGRHARGFANHASNSSPVVMGEGTSAPRGNIYMWRHSPNDPPPGMGPSILLSERLRGAGRRGQRRSLGNPRPELTPAPIHIGKPT